SSVNPPRISRFLSSGPAALLPSCKYGDDKMINSYQIAVSSRRGLSSPSAGKEELKIANEFKKNAEYLESLYPKTATIFYNLFEHYKRESKIERLDAENGWY
ncbi:MAG: hypothetical protein KHX08_07665, partial [Clostridiales bacterium]|nr:hypothetical protein [Clostridiales bacterium]